MKYEARKKAEQNLHYKLEQWNKPVTFDIMNNISEYVILFQLMDSVRNIYYAVSVFENWIFDYNNEKSLLFNIDSLYLICACYDEED